MSTTPITHDYPDWGRQVATADIIVANHVNENAVANVNDPVRFVGQYSYIHLRGGSNVVNMFVTLGWYMDQAATIFVGADECGAFVATDLVVSFPVQAPFVKIIIQLAAYPNTFNLQATMASTPHVPYAGFAGCNDLISVFNGGPLGGGLSVTINAQATRGGVAYVEMDVLGATNFLALVRVTDKTGGITTIASNYPAVRTRPIMIFLPPLLLDISLQNLDAGAHNYRALLIHKTIPL